MPKVAIKKIKELPYICSVVNTYYIYNQSMDFKTIDLFNKNKKHTGVVHVTEGNQKLHDKSTQLFHKNHSGYLKIVRIQLYHNRLPLFNPITIIENGKATKVMPMYYFSSYQNQASIFEISVNRKVKDFNILYPLSHNENVYMSLHWIKDKDIKNIKADSTTFNFITTSPSGSKKKVKFNKFPSDYNPHNPYPKKQLCFVVNNTTKNTMRVDLLGLLSGKKYDGIEFDSPIADISKTNIFNNFKVVSVNTTQILQALVLVEKGIDLESKDIQCDSSGNAKGIKTIYTSPHFSAYQNQTFVVDVNVPLEFSDKDSLFVDILGETKCMYYFYEHEQFKLKK